MRLESSLLQNSGFISDVRSHTDNVDCDPIAFVTHGRNPTGRLPYFIHFRNVIMKRLPPYDKISNDLHE